MVLVARGIDHAEFEAEQMRVAFAAISRHAGLVVDQGELLADEPVEQCRLADIGAADDGDGG